MEETTVFAQFPGGKSQASAFYAGYRIMLLGCFFKTYQQQREHVMRHLLCTTTALHIYEEKNSSAFVILYNVGSRSFG